MISFFTPAPNDASLGYLSQIFGNVNGMLPVGGDISILGTMFVVFNSVLLAVGAIVIIYTIIVGVMMTAHEGEFLKQWNSMWTPIKALVGIASLIPTSSGFSGLQIIMMWVIVQGVGAADTLWNSAVEYTRYLGSPFAQISVTDAGTSQNMTFLFQSVMCDETARQNLPLTYVTKEQTGAFYCGIENPNVAYCGSAPATVQAGGDPSVPVNTILFGPNGACGKLTYCNEAWRCAAPIVFRLNGEWVANPEQSPASCRACKAQIQSLKKVIGDGNDPGLFRVVAKMYAKDVDFNYQNYYNNGYTSDGRRDTNVPMSGWIADYCKQANISDAFCRGPLGGAKKATTDPSRAGGLPDPYSMLGSAPDDVVTNVYGPYMVGVLGDFIQSATDEYTNEQIQTLQDAIPADSADAFNSANRTGSDQAFDAMESTGWLFAGAYYYTIVQGAKSKFDAANVPFEVTTTNPNVATSAAPNPLQNYRNNFDAASVLIDISTDTQAKGQQLNFVAMNSFGGQCGIKIAGKCFPGFKAATKAMGNSMIAATAPSNTNPIAQLATAGYALLLSASIIFLVSMGILLAVGIATGFSIFALGDGVINPLTSTGVLTAMLVLPVFLALMVVMITIGVSLGVYVPLIPYMLFTFGAIGWMMSTIETMVAGPLVAVGILMPGRHQDLLGKAEPALMLLFNVFIRPSLMIFGMIAAMLLANVVVQMINKMFFSVMYQIIGIATHSSSKALAYINPLELMFFFIAYVVLIIAALNKCFAAIHVIPEKVVRWIGGQAESYGEDQALGEIKSGVDAGAQKTAGMMKGAGDSLTASGKEGIARRNKAAEKQREANQANIKGGGGGDSTAGG